MNFKLPSNPNQPEFLCHCSCPSLGLGAQHLGKCNQCAKIQGRSWTGQEPCGCEQMDRVENLRCVLLISKQLLADKFLAALSLSMKQP